MSHVLTSAPDAPVPLGTNASIEQRFAAIADPRRPGDPNILLIQADLGAASIGAYAGEAVQTPNIDRLAKSGTRFTNAANTGTAPLSLILEPLDETGYDAGRFEAADPAVAFLGLRREAPWSAYVSLCAADADDAVGTLVTALRRSDQYRQTLVLLLGASGSPTPTLLAWPGQVPPRQRHDGPVLDADWLPTVLEIARPGASCDHGFGGLDLTPHLFDGGAMPERHASAAATRAA